MYYEKPELVSPPAYLHPTEQAGVVVQPDSEQSPDEFVEPAPAEEQRERRGDNLWRVLHERHINMITFSGTIGNGLFLGSGTSIASAGPGGAVMAYVIMGTVISSVISCLGEMTALMPVNAPIMEFPRRFLDRGVGFAVGWMYWFAYAVMGADQLVAVSNTIKFSYDDGRTVLNWTVGQSVDNAVWITVFLAMIIVINLFPVRVYGELEYIFGSMKIIFITLLIVMMFILDVMQPRAGAYYTEPLGTKYWNNPWSFFNPSYGVIDENGNIERTISGSLGTFLGVWTTLINVLFSYVGMDILAATAAESTALSDAESMKMGARKINIRVITLYTLAVLTASFVVPYDHPFLNGAAQSEGAGSIFVIAVVQAGMPAAAHFFNAFYVFSTFSCCINNLYVASRVLHTMALRGQTGPEWITRRLRQTRAGVPMRAVIATALVFMIAYMGRSGDPATRLGELSNNSTVSCCIVYIVICATYLSFYQILRQARLYGNISEAQASCYARDNELYPYKSHGQWLKALYGMVACSIVLVFNGVASFLDEPFDVGGFLSAYIGIPVFIILVLGYKINRHGLRIWEYGFERSGDLSNTVQASSPKRKGRLEFEPGGWTGENVGIFFKWIWVWLK